MFSHVDLAFPRPHREFAFHFLQATLFIIIEMILVENERRRFWTDTQRAFEYLDRVAGCDIRSGLEHTMPHRQSHKIREIFYEILTGLRGHNCPASHFPHVEIGWQWQLEIMLLWCTGSPRIYLHAKRFNLAMAQHFGVPISSVSPFIFPTNVPVTHPVRCTQNVRTPNGHSQHPRLHLYVYLLYRRAGWHTISEQIVRTNEIDNKRVDLVSMIPEIFRVEAGCYGNRRFEIAKSISNQPTPWSRFPDGWSVSFMMFLFRG